MKATEPGDMNSSYISTLIYQMKPFFKSEKFLSIFFNGEIDVYLAD